MVNTQSSSHEEDSRPEGIKKLENMQFDLSGGDRSISNRFNDFFKKEMLPNVSSALVKEALDLIEDEIQEDKGDGDALFSWKKALEAVRSCLSRDSDKVVREIAASAQRLEPLLSLGQKFPGLKLKDKKFTPLKDAAIQLSGIVDHLALADYPKTIKTIEEWHAKRDEKMIEEARNKLNRFNIS